MDSFEAVMIAEEGDDDAEKQLEAWQYLIDTGLCWQLQGWFGRTAEGLIQQGKCSRPKDWRAP